jgi:UDP-N-acetylmuramate--alanine ligase
MNTLPSLDSKIHLIGIGGDGQTGLAGLLLGLGYQVVGSNYEAEKKIKQRRLLDELEARGARIHFGHRAEHIEAGTGLVVPTSVVRKDNPELIAAESKGIRLASRAMVLGEIMERYSERIAVAGTAGKTTTTAMLCHALQVMGLEPGYCLGSPLLEAPYLNYALGKGEVFIAEADEFNRSFHHLPRDIGVITEYFYGDHADYYSTEAEMMDSFGDFVRGVTKSGAVVAYGDNPEIRDITRSANSEVVLYGFSANCDWQLRELEYKSSTTSFQLVNARMDESYDVVLSVPGAHNALNASAAILSARRLGYSASQVARALHDYPGTERRLQLIGTSDAGVCVYDDFAHNPQQIRASVAALRQIHTSGRIFCVFEPRQYRRTKFTLLIIHQAFFDVEAVFIMDISEGIGDTEEHIKSVSAHDVVRALSEKGVDARYCVNLDEMPKDVAAVTQPGDAVLVCGTGRMTMIANGVLNTIR